VEYVITLSGENMPKIRKTAETVAKRYNLHLFKGSKRDLLKIAPQIFEVLDEAYRNLYGTVPLSPAQVKFYIDSYFGFAIVDMIPVVLDENDRVVAFGITFPSFSEALQKSKGSVFPFGFIHFLKAMRRNEWADLYLVGVRDEYRGQGVNSMLMVQIYDAFIKYGVKYVAGNPNLEDNIHVQTMWKFFSNRLRKRRRVFVKHLS
jgi:GNAT superfamily N-acetyltransferase